MTTHSPDAAAPAQSLPEVPCLYSVQAFRWGELNNHNYLVGVYATREEALSVAEEARDDRAGKYGVEVRRWQAGAFGDREAYFCSMGHEAAPEDSYSREHLFTFGASIKEVALLGYDYVYDEALGHNVPVKRSVPRWLKEAARQQLELRLHHDACEQDRKAHPAEPLTAPVSRGDWKARAAARAARVEPVVAKALNAELARLRACRKLAFSAPTKDPV